MRIWLITIGEPLPTDPDEPRLLRVGELAELLVARGHEVVWWSSTMDHNRKVQRAQAYAEIAVRHGYTLRLLHGCRYARNVSLARVLNHDQIARQFRRLAADSAPPDVILCSYPSIELCREGVRYGRSRRIPVVADIRDLWPDSFLGLVPPYLRPLLKPLLWNLFRASREALRDATALTGTTDEIRDWGLQRAGRPRTARDATFPLAYSGREVETGALAEAEAYWDRLGVTRDRFIACFFGTMTKVRSLRTVIAAAEILNGDATTTFVLCGAGDDFDELRRLTAGLRNVVMPGWVNRAKIKGLMARAAVGLAPYGADPGLAINIPNKAIEYWSAGLPILTNLGGVLGGEIQRQGCGRVYLDGDADSLATALTDLRMNPDSRRALGANARRLYEEKYVAEVVYHRFAEHLEQVTAAGSPPGVQPPDL